MNRRSRSRPFVFLPLLAAALAAIPGGCANPPGGALGGVPPAGVTAPPAEPPAAIPAAPAPPEGPAFPPRKLSGLSVRELIAKKTESLKHLSLANTHADAWRVLKEDGLRKQADAGYRAAVDGHEILLKTIRENIRSFDPERGGVRTAESIREEKILPEMEWNVRFELAQMYIFWGRLYPDDNPDPGKGNAKVERGNDLLNELRVRIMEQLKKSKGEVERDVIPPSFYFLKALVMWQRGREDDALKQFQHAIEGMKPKPEMAGALVQTYFNKAEFLLEKAGADKEKIADALATTEALLGATTASAYAPMHKRAEIMKAKVLLLQGKPREALDLAKPYLGDPDSRIRQTLAAQVREAAAKVLPAADIPPLPPPPPPCEGISDLPLGGGK